MSDTTDTMSSARPAGGHPVAARVSLLAYVSTAMIREPPRTAAATSLWGDANVRRGCPNRESQAVAAPPYILDSAAVPFVESLPFTAMVDAKSAYVPRHPAVL